MFGDFEKYIAAFLTALLVTYLLTPLVRALACRFGVMDLPNERRPMVSVRLFLCSQPGSCRRRRVSLA